MKLDTLIISALVAIGVTMADEWRMKKINHDEVKPFPQRVPTTDAERAAVMFKPQLLVRNVCYPYPAVNEAGETSGGLKVSGDPWGDCEGSSLGSQIYVRSRPFNGFYVLVYMWYFPKTGKSRHGFFSVIVIIDNPELDYPNIVACSLTDPKSKTGFDMQYPCPPDYISGNSIKIKYEQIGRGDQTMSLTDEAGTFQDLVTWDQMSASARKALNSAAFDNQHADINDGSFEVNIKKAWPFLNDDGKSF